MSRYLLIITLFIFSNAAQSQALTSQQFIDHLNAKSRDSNQTMIAAEQAAYDVYMRYKDNLTFKANPQRLVRHTASVYNFFKTRIGSTAILPPDRQASLHIFLNSNPHLNTTAGISDNADLVAKAYNTNECQRAGSSDCDLLTDDELDSLKVIDEKLAIRSFFKNAQNQIVSDFQALSAGVANTVRSVTAPAQNTSPRPRARPSHVINCEISPPNYNRCVTVDGIVYVRQSSQPISDIESHLRKAGEQRDSSGHTGTDASN